MRFTGREVKGLQVQVTEVQRSQGLHPTPPCMMTMYMQIDHPRPSEKVMYETLIALYK